MPPVKRKRCCVPYCKNVQEISKKQFFKIGANLQGRQDWPSSIGKLIAAKSQMLYCCEDHFDLPNDAENYIRYKYVPGTKLKLRPNVLPQKKLPINVCRLCLNLIYNEDDFVDVSVKKGSKYAQIVAESLPEIDLFVTVDPVVCLKCFEPLEQYHMVKQNALKSEVIVVNCIKTIVNRSPTRLIKNCEIDLFEEYNDIMLQKEKEKLSSAEESLNDVGTQITKENQEKKDENVEEIVLEIVEKNEMEDTNKSDFLSGSILAEFKAKTDYDKIENISYSEGTSEVANIISPSIQNSAIENSDGKIYYEVIEDHGEISAKMYSSEDLAAEDPML